MLKLFSSIFRYDAIRKPINKRMSRTSRNIINEKKDACDARFVCISSNTSAEEELIKML